MDILSYMRVPSQPGLQETLSQKQKLLFLSLLFISLQCWSSKPGAWSMSSWEHRFSDGCELHVGAGSRTPVLWESSQCSQPQAKPSLHPKSFLYTKPQAFQYKLKWTIRQVRYTFTQWPSVSACMEMFPLPHRKFKGRPGEMVQWLRAVAGVPEDPGSIRSTHLAAHNCL